MKVDDLSLKMVDEILQKRRNDNDLNRGSTENPTRKAHFNTE